jgi:plasmid stabilization system protein ParE
MAQARWTVGALQDVETITAHLSSTSAERALTFGQSITITEERLRTFPRSGRSSQFEFASDIREVALRPYRLFYRIADVEVVEILAVIDGRRNVRRVMRQRWSVN